MKRNPTGHYVSVSSVGDEVCKAFVPLPLPPAPPLEISPSLAENLEHASVALGRLDGISTFLPNSSLFLYSYIRKEAVLSSQIEGTQSSLSDLLQFEIDEAPGVPLEDVGEVSNYISAMNHGLKRLKEGFPLSNRLLREMHGILLSKGRGSDKDPGEFRRSQNWIGGSRPGNATYVPPPQDLIPDCMGHLEKFLNNEPQRVSPIIKAALAHVQFETIHPFLDGNGRLGRLLITLLFCSEGILSEPCLYLSYYFKMHRSRYYELLSRVREDGDWEVWLDFFATGIRETSKQAVETAISLSNIIQKDKETIQTIGKGAGSALRLHDALVRSPYLTIPKATKITGLSNPTVINAFKTLAKKGIVRETTGKKRRWCFVYSDYLAILEGWGEEG